MVLRSTLVVLAIVFFAIAQVGAQTVTRSLECAGRIICELRGLSTLEAGEMIGGGTRVAGNERLAWFGQFGPTGAPIWFTLDPTGSRSEGGPVEGQGKNIYVGGSTGGSANAFVRKLSASGATVWERIIPGEGAITGIRDLSASPGGPLFVATGKTVSRKTSSIVLTAFSAQGELLWEKTATGLPDGPIGRTVAPAGAQVLALDDGCLLLVAKGKKLVRFRFSQSGELVNSRDIPLPLISEPEDANMLTIGEAVLSPDGGVWFLGSFGPFSRTS